MNLIIIQYSNYLYLININLDGFKKNNYSLIHYIIIFYYMIYYYLNKKSNKNII